MKVEQQARFRKPIHTPGSRTDDSEEDLCKAIGEYARLLSVRPSAGPQQMDSWRN